jgi:pyridoxamine 5'-phosphate oxidase
MVEFSDHERKDYGKHTLHEADAGADPIVLFSRWFQESRAAGVLEHNAMVLATHGTEGPTTRVVLLRGFDGEGFRFFTNYNSPKMLDVERDARVALLLFWPQMERQVRITGVAEKIHTQASDSYFAQRPRDSRIGAWSSDQSAPVRDRTELEERRERWLQRFEGKEVPRPEHWGGVRVVPNTIEFWQGGAARLHDRLKYIRAEGGLWGRTRLQP